jgi:hypothetical protein
VKEVWPKETQAVSTTRVLSKKKSKLFDLFLKKWRLTLSNLKLLIAKCNMEIFFCDELEDESDLFTPEPNFRKIVKLHYEKLLRFSNCIGKNGVLLEVDQSW